VPRLRAVFRTERIVVSRLLATPSHTPEPPLTRSPGVILGLCYSDHADHSTPSSFADGQGVKAGLTTAIERLLETQRLATLHHQVCSPPEAPSATMAGIKCYYARRQLYRAGKHGTQLAVVLRTSHARLRLYSRRWTRQRPLSHIEAEISLPSQRPRSTF
jgi:hypothetical protein